MYNLTWLLIALLFSFTTLEAKADFSMKSYKSISLSAGNWMEYYGQTQTSRNGDEAELEFAPYMAASIEYSINEKSSLIPEVGYVIQRDAGDSDISKNLFFFRSDYSYSLNEWLRLRAGTSFMILMISSNGGERKLPNGDGSETYYLPSERRTAINQTIDLGAEALYRDYSLRFQTYIYSALDSERRIYSYSLSLNYIFKFGEI